MAPLRIGCSCCDTADFFNRSRIIELRQLRYFLAVAELGGFRKAAAELHVAQPPLSQQVAALERELGVTLFDRTARGSTLTDAAQALLPHIRRVISAADYAVETSRDLKSGNTGTIRLGFVGSAAFRIVPQLVTAHGHHWPKVQFDLQELPNDRQVALMREGRLDAGILRTDTYYAGMESLWLMDEPILAALPADHPLADDDVVWLRDLRHESFIGIGQDRSPHLFEDTAAMCRLAGFRYQPKRWGAEFTTILGLAAAGLGVAIVPQSLSSLRLPGIRYLRLAEDFAHSPIYLVRPQAEHTRLSDLLVASAKQLVGSLSTEFQEGTTE